MSRSTKFSLDWIGQYPRVTATNDIHSVRCNLFRKTFSIKNCGISQVQQHSKTKSHIKNNSEMRNQRTFVSSGKKLSEKQSIILDEEQTVLHAEVCQALRVVEKNQSFCSANGNTKHFKRMFADSLTAAKYSQEETKMKYVIQFGVTPYLFENLKKDVEKKVFSFKFDESTTEQAKKQYDAYLTFYSTEFQRIITAYCGSLFVGHCTAQDLVEHFFEFVEKLSLKPAFLQSLGMDGPNFDKLFEKKLRAELKEKFGIELLDLGTCSLHSANNAFNKGLKVLKTTVDLDEFAINLHFFFKYSSARREDYKNLEELTDLTSEFVIKHCQTRWISLDKVLVRISEQFCNLHNYYLEHLPTQSEFNSKKGVSRTE